MSSAARVSPGLRSAGVVGVAMAGTNLLTYAFILLAAHTLSPREFGVLSSLAGLLALGSAPMLALQAEVGRRTARLGAVEQAEAHRAARATGLRVALVVGAVGVLAAPLVTTSLRLNPWAVACVILALVPTTWLGVELGTLLGASAWPGYAAANLGFGAARVFCGGAGLAVRPDPLGAIAGVAVGAGVSLLVARPLAARASGLDHVAANGPKPSRDPSLARDCLHVVGALLALYALTNVDVLLARMRMTGFEAGLYAAGVVLGRAAFFLPQFVTVIVFPRLAAAADPRALQRRAAAAVLGVGVLVTLAAWLLPRLAVAFVGGGRYDALGPDLWCFAAAGSALSLCHLALYARIARADRRAVRIGWGGVTLLVVAGWLVAPQGPAALALTVAAVGGLVAAVGLRSRPDGDSGETPRRPSPAD